VQWKAAIANALWSASNLPAYVRFCRALDHPEPVQTQKLRSFLKQNARTAFGKAHQFEKISSYKEFTARVPLADYESFVPWIDRIMRGEANVLTQESVTHLVPTSGSRGARKLVPFTCGLQDEFNAAIGPWLVDLQRQQPGLIGGPAYWSVTPNLKGATAEALAIPVGFDADTAYLGGTRKWLADAVMAVPSAVQLAESMEAFRYETLLHLLCCRELRLISIWHPSFLMLLLEAVYLHWETLLDDIAHGRKGSMMGLPERSSELRRMGPDEPRLFWPGLRLISCWGDGHAEMWISELQSEFPEVAIQRKGLLATEAVVTIPFHQRQPLAIRSHFFEFLDEQNHACLAHELRDDQEYEVVVTTAGGFCRYRLQDRVRVNGFVGTTPCLRFIGRSGSVSDLFGEKLSEQFVSEAIHMAIASVRTPKFMLLAPDEDDLGCHYTFYVEGEMAPDVIANLDILLRKNPHYDWCRKVGQLRAPRLFQITADGFQSFLQRECANGRRIGDVKPLVLSARTAWSQHFQGRYVHNSLLRYPC